jgi:hypothetical protein
MVLTTRQVAASADDAHESDVGVGTNFDRTRSYVRVDAHSQNTSRYNGGLRFANVTIAQGTSILRAWLDIQVIEANPNMNVDIHAEDEDDAADFETTEDVTSRTRTSTSVAWAEDGLPHATWQRAPNIASVVEEVFARATWSSGNALVLLLDGRSDLNRACFVYSYDGDSPRAAQLSIKTGTATAPALTLRNQHSQRNARFAPLL